jgi:hypothetical protein
MCHGFDPSKYTASSMFYLPAQAAAGPEASFFLVFDGDKRQAIDPYQWIDKTIINHRPEPDVAAPQFIASSEPKTFIRKDPKLVRALEAMEAEKLAHRRQNYQQRVDAALERWHEHPVGTGNDAFFQLAVALAGAGMERAEIGRTLHAEAAHAHGSKSQQERRAAIPGILRKLKCAA